MFGLLIGSSKAGSFICLAKEENYFFSYLVPHTDFLVTVGYYLAFVEIHEESSHCTALRVPVLAGKAPTLEALRYSGTHCSEGPAPVATLQRQEITMVIFEGHALKF